MGPVLPEFMGRPWDFIAPAFSTLKMHFGPFSGVFRSDSVHSKRGDSDNMN